jgi:hypothetical protein
MKCLIALMAALLVGCATTKTEYILQTVYVVRKASAEQKRLPPYPAPINVKKSNQNELATWIADSEDRQRKLERQITELVKFYEAPVAPAAVASGAAK